MTHVQSSNCHKRDSHILTLSNLEYSPNMAWRLRFSDEMRVRGVLYMKRAIQVDVLP